MYEVVNLTERAVVETVDGILPTLPNVCGCERCRADIICATLNVLPPRYTTHRFGEILSQAEFDGSQRKTEVITAVMRSVRRVQESPHDDKASHRRLKDNPGPA